MFFKYSVFFYLELTIAWKIQSTFQQHKYTSKCKKVCQNARQRVTEPSQMEIVKNHGANAISLHHGKLPGLIQCGNTIPPHHATGHFLNCQYQWRSAIVPQCAIGQIPSHPF